MLLAFDVGNSAVKCAARERGEWEVIFRCENRPREDLEERLVAYLEGRGGALPEDGRPLACSVCPEAEGALLSAWAESGRPGELKFFGRDVPIPMRTGVREPEEVGCDRLLCALGARSVAGAPCVVVGVGTAVTVDLVDPEGRFAGGAIAPGPHLAARALSEETAFLPLVEPTPPGEVAGVDTEEAIRSGVYWFCCGGVSAMVERLRELPGCQDAGVVLTGGGADLLRQALAEARFESLLVFRGISQAVDTGALND